MTAINVSSGQISAGIVLGAGASMTILSGGRALNTTVESAGSQLVFSGGNESGTVVSSGGSVEVFNGGVGIGTVVSGGSMAILSGGDGLDSVVAGGIVQVQLGGAALGTTVFSGGELDVSSGGAIGGTTNIVSGGALLLYSGAEVGGTTSIVSGGSMEIAGGFVAGTATPITGVSGGIADGVTVDVIDLGSAVGLSVKSGGTETISSDGLASDTTVSNGGYLIISAGGSTSGTTVDSGGTLIVSSGGTAGFVNVSAGGTIELIGGAVLSGSNSFASGSILAIGSGYVLGSGTPISGISGGGTINTDEIIEILSGGMLSGGNTGLSFNFGPQVELTRGALLNGKISIERLEVASGYVLTANTPISGISGGVTGIVTVMSGGLTSGLSIAGGGEIVSSGGTASGTIISAGGSEVILSGGAATGIAIDGGGLFLAGGSLGSGPIIFGPGADALTIESGTAAPTNAISGFVSGNLIFLPAVLTSAGVVSLNSQDFLSVTEGGSNYVLNFSGTPLTPSTDTFAVVPGAAFLNGEGAVEVELAPQIVTVAAGTTSTSASVPYGTLLVDSGTTVSASISGAGVEIVAHSAVATTDSTGVLVVNSGGTATGTILTSGGTEFVLAGAVDLYTTLSGGRTYSEQLVFGTVTSTTVSGYQFIYSGGVARATELGSGGYQDIYAGGEAAGTTVGSGGTQLVQDGIASATVVSGGSQLVSSGTALNTLVSSGGIETISSGAEVIGTTVGASGFMAVSAGGTALNTFIQDNGFAFVSAGGTAIGTTVDSGGILLALPGADVAGTFVLPGAEAASTGAIFVSGQTVIVFGAGGLYGGVVASGTEYVLPDGVASGTTVESSGSQLVLSGGTALAMTLISGGREIVSSGGIASATSVGVSGGEVVSAGGTANGATVGSGGFEVIYPGGSASGTTVSNGGVLIIAPSARVNGTVSAAGATVISTGVLVLSGGVIVAGPTPILSNFTVSPGEIGYVLPGGSAVDTSVFAGGELLVFSGGTDINTGNQGGAGGGHIVEYEPAHATFTTVSGPGGNIQQTGSDNFGVLSAYTFGLGQTYTFSSEGVASSISIIDGGAVIVDSGGTAISTTISIGGVETVSTGGVTSFAAVSSGGSEIVSSGGTAVSATVSGGGLLVVSSGGVASGTAVSNGGLIEVAADGSAIATTVSPGGIMLALPGATVAGTQTLAGGLTVSSGVLLLDGSERISGPSPSFTHAIVNSGEREVVLPSGVTISALVFDGGSELIYSGGIASGSRIQPYGSQLVFAGGAASGTVVSTFGSQTVSSGGTALGTVVMAGGGEVVSSGGVASSTIISGGLVELQPGAVVGGPITFAGGGVLQIDDGETTPSSTILGLGVGDTIDLAGLNFGAGGAATLTPTGNVLEVTEGSQTDNLHLDPSASFSNIMFELAPDGSGGTDVAELVAAAPPFVLDNNQQSLAQGATATIGPSLLRFGDSDTSAAGLTYTITSGPQNGTLLLNGKPTASFSGAEVNSANALNYQETAPGVTSDSFAFTVSDPYGDATPTQTFDITISSTVPPFALDINPLALTQGTTATIGPALLRFGDVASTAAQVVYTVTSGPGDGTLLLNNEPTTSFTGAEGNAGELSYEETAPGATSDSFSFVVSDPYGNTTGMQTFHIAITPTTPPFALDNGPLSTTQGTTATIGPSLLRFGDIDTTAAGISYTVISGPSDGALLLNNAPTTSFTGAEANAGELSYGETALGATSDSFSFKVSDPYGNSTATQTFNIGITSTALPFALDDSPLTLGQDATATIGPSVLRFGDVASAAAQLLYTVTSGPSNGMLLLNNLPTTSFTGAEVNAGEISYKETAAGASADSFSFKVSDPYGNTTATETFSFQITSPPFALDNSPLTLTQGTTAMIGPGLLRYGDSDTTAAGITYTVTGGPSDGTLLLNNSPTTSFTGAEVNAGELSYEETALGATSDVFSFTVADPFGSMTPTQSFHFQIVSTVPPFELDDNPLSIAQGATATIGPSLLRFGDPASTAAQVLYTVTGGPGDGMLLLNNVQTSSFTGAEVNSNELTYHETAPGAVTDGFSFTVSDPYGNITGTQHFQIAI